MNTSFYWIFLGANAIQHQNNAINATAIARRGVAVVPIWLQAIACTFTAIAVIAAIVMLVLIINDK